MEISCTVKEIEDLGRSADNAAEINPVNRPANAFGWGDLLPPARIAALTSKYWGAGGVRLPVAFLDNPPADLRSRILAHMNAWSSLNPYGANIQFMESGLVNSVVRISRGQGGYWSYLGTDCRLVRSPEPTMNLEGFTMQTPESEFIRVVRHETGHTLGFPHEHMRGAIIGKLDRNKTIEYFGRTQGWTPQEVVSQVLTPIEEAALLTPGMVEDDSIMTYQLPGSITIDGIPIRGGTKITDNDFKYAAKIYPAAVAPVVPVTEQPWTITVSGSVINGKIKVNTVKVS